jgi:hypothetical protein
MACYIYKGNTYTKEELLAIKNQIIAENEAVFNQMGSEALNDVNVLVDQLVKGGLAEEVIVGNTQTLLDVLDEAGVSEDLRQQVVAWHGSPYDFYKFTTEAMGTGEGKQAFGWGLYFTDLESIAKTYANNESLIERHLNSVYEFGVPDRFYQIPEERRKNKENLITYIDTQIEGFRGNTFQQQEWQKLKDAITSYTPNLYKVTLFKDKTPDQYTWLEWDKTPTKIQKEKLIDIVKNINVDEENNPIGKIAKQNFENDLNKGAVNAYIYGQLAILTDDNTGKKASLLLLENGIDGVKFPAESIATGATSETARGFNYVVFDENAITIEEQVKFQKALQEQGIKMIPTGFVKGNKVYINSDVATIETPIHEFAHLYNAWLKENKVELYNRGLELVRAELDKKNSPIQSVIDYVKSTQPNLQGEALQEEILTQLTGKKGLELLQSKKKGGIINWIKEALAEIANMLGLSNYSVEQAMNMTIDEFAKAIAVDLLKGEKLYQKATQAENYYQRNADRLPLTLSVFNRPEFLAMQGKMVNPITVLNSLNQTGIKQVEKDLIKGVIEENYPGQKKISYDDLEATVRANIMPLERIFTSSYADYGMNNLGDGNYGNANTIILNAPIEHGITGHFSGAFKASGRKNIKYVPKQLNDNTWVAVEEGYEAGANENNIYQFVGTAGTKESVDAWIDNYKKGGNRPLTKENTKLVKDGSRYILLDDKNSPIITLDKEDINFNRDDIHQSVLDNYYIAYPTDINKGMFGHIRVWQDGEVMYGAELQSDYFQKNNAKKKLIEKSDGFTKIEQDKNSLNSELLSFVPNNLEIKPIYGGLNKWELRGLSTVRQSIKLEDLVKMSLKETNSLNETNQNEINRLAKEIQNLEKSKDKLYENLSPQEKQFIASQKEWEKRMVREAIKEASLSGATSLRFPTPYTLSVIEGYIEGNGTGAIQLNSEGTTEIGDTLEYLGEDYTIISEVDYDDSVRIVRTSEVKEIIIEDFIDEMVDNDMSEVYVEEGDKFYSKDTVDNSEAQRILDDLLEQKAEEEGTELQDTVLDITSDIIEEIRDSIRTRIKEDVEYDPERYFQDWGYANIVEKDGVVYYTQEGIESEYVSLTQNSASKEDFEISNLNDTQQTVARKYEEIADILKQERGGENVEIITDENGFDWYETKLAPEEVNQPVIAFQKQFEIPTEETTTIPDCV